MEQKTKLRFLWDVKPYVISALMSSRIVLPPPSPYALLPKYGVTSYKIAVLRVRAVRTTSTKLFMTGK